MTTYDLDVMVLRGDVTESRHRVHAAVVDAGGDMLGRAGDPDLVTHWRSCAKPLQVMPLLRSGHADRLGWGDEQIALACASHGGEPEHVVVVNAMLASLGLEEGDLACGPHTPLTARGARLLREQGLTASRVHNNCSGKHAAMLALAKGSNWSILDYQLSDHPVQQAARDTVAEWSGIPAERILCGVDGCSVVTFALPLSGMARSFARLAEAARRHDESAARIVTAMRTNPFLVGGTDRFDTVLMEESGGSILAKVGAEGVHTVVLLDEQIGFAVKVEDGSPRAQQPAVLRMLQHLGALPATLSPRLETLARAPVNNTRGEQVGEVRCHA
ncbi:MAG TPA: asparaginase [Gemmatimonadaceae bacterium]|nr:asparaginase [Gemmatimonadaceae bacterium]